jgi:hypothetical protein
MVKGTLKVVPVLGSETCLERFTGSGCAGVRIGIGVRHIRKSRRRGRK